VARLVRFSPGKTHGEDAMTYWKGLIDRRRHRPRLGHGVPGDGHRSRSGTALDVVAEWPQPLDELTATGRLEDSLMVHLQQNPQDVDCDGLAGARLRRPGWYDAAINPLARGLQVDPKRRSLWAALDEALGKLGKAKITDVELTEKRGRFVEAVGDVGHGWLGPSSNGFARRSARRVR